MSDTTVITKDNASYFRSHDTLQLFSNNSGYVGLDTDFDYEVHVLQAGRIFRLSDFYVQHNEVKVGLSMDKTSCINPVKSYMLDGVQVSGASDYHDIYLHH